MPWIRLDDGFADHPKVEKAGPLAAWLHVAALCYCGRHLTDGRIPMTKARRLVDIPTPQRHIDALVEAGLWHEDDDDYVIHDYLEFQPSREEVEEGRAIARRRSAMNANPALRDALRARDGDDCRYCGRRVSWRDRKGPGGGTYDHVIPVVAGGGETLENLVVACRKCNSKKGPRTPEQAGMVLRPPPIRPDPGSNGTKPGSIRDLDGIYPDSERDSDNPSHPDPSLNQNNARGSQDATPALKLVPDSVLPAAADVALERFAEHFWPTYPKRNGKRLGRSKAVAQWQRLKVADQRAAVMGARNYAAAVEAGLTIAKDAERWLRDRCWEDWQEPATPDRTKPTEHAPATFPEASSRW